MMAPHDFDARLKHIEEQYAARREGADAYRDQEMARLFEECGWDVRQIADRVTKVTGKQIRKSHVSRRLIFGRFLKLSPAGDKTQGLTERRFREHWKRTEGKEEERFAAVLHVLEHGIPQGREAIAAKPGIQDAVAATLADGKSYTVEQITATVEESLTGVTERQVRQAIGQLRRHPPDGHQVKTKSLGKKSQYRMVSAEKRTAAGKPASPIAALYEQITPLIEELEEMGRRHHLMMTPSQVRMVAAKLRRLFDAVLEPATA